MKKQAFLARNPRFSPVLLKWNKEKNNRAMPWKGERDPYRIWLSEIILQQTRVEQGLSYYNKFIQQYPTIKTLAKARDEEVFKLWEGLGYYSRCRNLLATARFISKELKGKFPTDYEAILKLKGVGRYTAAAIASFAYNMPYAVVDGNVFRVLSRITGNNTPIDSTSGKKYFTALANEWLDKKNPGIYNQAIMDFGATVCKPLAPLCGTCPFNKVCTACLKGKVKQLPVKEKKISIKKRWFYYFILQYKNEMAIILREKKDIWQGLYEFPLIETEGPMEMKGLLPMARKMKWLGTTDQLIEESALFKQQLSHQLIEGRFIVIEVKKKPANKTWKWVSEKSMKDLAFPRIINNYFEK
jgi:A/G-specific adenine glycosylase